MVGTGHAPPSFLPQSSALSVCATTGRTLLHAMQRGRPQEVRPQVHVKLKHVAFCWLLY